MMRVRAKCCMPISLIASIRAGTNLSAMLVSCSFFAACYSNYEILKTDSRLTNFVGVISQIFF